MSTLPENKPQYPITVKVAFFVAIASLILLFSFYAGQTEQKSAESQRFASSLFLSCQMPYSIKLLFNRPDPILKNPDLINQKNQLINLFNKDYFNKTQKVEPVATTPQNNLSAVAKKITIVTAYSSTPDQTDDTPYTTAMGTFVRDGVVAANWLKFGTKVRLPEIYGDKIFVVEDRMALRNAHKLDIWMDTRNEALDFGIRKLRVEIMD